MRARSRHSLFFRYLCMFLLVLIIPAGIMGSSIWGRMHAALWKEIESSMQSASCQVVSMLDQYMVGMDALATLLATNPDVRTMTAMIGSDFASIEKTTGVRKMNDYKTPHAFINRIMVANNGYILSSEGLLLSQEETGISQILRDIGNNRFAYRPDVMRDNLYYIRKLFVLRENGQYLLCEIPRSIFVKLMSALPHAGDVQALILEGEGNVIFSNREENMLLSLMKDAQDNQWRRLSYEGKGYLLYAIRMERMNLRALFLLPEHVMSAPLNQTFQILGAYLLISVLLGLGLSLWFAYRNYKPLKMVLRGIESEAAGGAQRGGGLKIISDVYDRMLQDNVRLRERVQREQVYTARHFMLNVLRGRYPKGTDLVQMAQQFNLSFSGQCFRVVMVLMQGTHPGNWNGEADEELQEIIGRAFMRNCQLSMLLIEPGCIAVVLNYMPSQVSETAIVQASDSAIGIIRERFAAGVTIGISEEQSELGDLHHAYAQAQSACEYRLIRGNNSVILSREIEGLMDDVSLRYIQAFRNQSDIQRHMESGNYNAIERNINQLFEDIGKSNLSVSLVRCLYYEIVNMVMRTVSFSFIKGIDVGRLLSMDTMDELRAGVLEVYRQACVERQVGKDRKGPVENAIEYIQKHYVQPHLSLDSVAASLDISRSYLSRIFSERMNMPLSEYINRLRIDAACTLMDASNLSIAQIAQHAGYQDLHTFLRNFKKYTGMTPTKYRERKTDASYNHIKGDET